MADSSGAVDIVGRISDDSPARAENVTAVILAGGQASRMGGVNKALVPLKGQPLVAHVLARVLPQLPRGLAQVAINTGRDVATLQAFAPQVWPDVPLGLGTPDSPPSPDTALGQHGPLHGLLTACTHAPTPWVWTVPCDAPALPLGTLEALMKASAGCDVVVAAYAATGDEAVGSSQGATKGVGSELVWQPTCLLVRRSVAPSLQAFLAQGQRKVRQWVQQQSHAVVCVGGAAHWVNLNTPEEMAAWPGPPSGDQHYPPDAT